MLPNGGFPPLEVCKKEKKTEDKKVEKGFFYSADKAINIRDILKKNKSKIIDIKKKEEEIETIDSI